MFGLQFAVSAGRCTKGVYLLPVKLEQKFRDRLKVDYIFVIDTEGLKSPELSLKSTDKRDRELSTFVIGLSHLSLIKLPGENTTYLQDILPISLHAFLRMNDVNLNPKTKIVHRNADKSSQNKMNTQNRILNEKLDYYTEKACQEERKEIKAFGEIINFDLTKDVHYLSSLYEGDDYRNAVIPKYSKEVSELKRNIVNGIGLQNQSSILDFSNHLKTLWEAIKKDDFVYEFKNTIEIQARGKLDVFWNQVRYNFEQKITDFENEAYIIIANCQSENELSDFLGKRKQELSILVDEIYFEQEQILKDFFEKSKKGEIEDAMQQWEASTLNKLRDLRDELEKKANKQIDSYKNTRRAQLTIKVSFNQENAQSAIASHLLRVFSEGIVEKVEQELADKIYQQMKRITHSQILNDKQSLIASVLISLAEKGSLNDYIYYIHNPEESIKTWIAKYVDEFNSEDSGIENIIKKQIEDLVYIANDSVEKTNRYIENNPENSNIQGWTEKFRELAENYLIFRNLEKVETFGNEIDTIDFDYIEDEISKGLNNTQSLLFEELSSFSESRTSDYSYLRSQVVEKIIASVIGCIEACPFCGEICISGMDNHESDHETPYHRPRGILGHRSVSGSPKLTTETCPQNVAGNGRFRNSDTNEEYIPYKDYRQVNDYYRSWKIHGDVSLESSSYWKWFMATYSSELAEYYDAEEPDINSSWKSLTKEKEIEKLRKIIQGDE